MLRVDRLSARPLLRGCFDPHETLPLVASLSLQIAPFGSLHHPCQGIPAVERACDPADSTNRGSEHDDDDGDDEFIRGLCGLSPANLRNDGPRVSSRVYDGSRANSRGPEQKRSPQDAGRRGPSPPSATCGFLAGTSFRNLSRRGVVEPVQWQNLVKNQGCDIQRLRTAAGYHSYGGISLH